MNERKHVTAYVAFNMHEWRTQAGEDVPDASNAYFPVYFDLEEAELENPGCHIEAIVFSEIPMH